MIEVGFCSDVLGFNSEPNKRLRLTPPLASRGVGRGELGWRGWDVWKGRVSLRLAHRTGLAISAKGATKEGGARALSPLCKGSTERPMAKHGTF